MNNIHIRGVWEEGALRVSGLQQHHRLRFCVSAWRDYWGWIGGGIAPRSVSRAVLNRIKVHQSPRVVIDIHDPAEAELLLVAQAGGGHRSILGLG